MITLSSIFMISRTCLNKNFIYYIASTDNDMKNTHSKFLSMMLHQMDQFERDTKVKLKKLSYFLIKIVTMLCTRLQASVRQKPPMTATRAFVSKTLGGAVAHTNLHMRT